MLCEPRRPGQASWEMLPQVKGVICSVQTNLCLRVDGLRATSRPGYSPAVLLKAIPLRQRKAKPDHAVTEAPAGRFLYHTTRLTPDPPQSAKEGQRDQALRCSCDGTESTCKTMDKTPTKAEGGEPCPNNKFAPPWQCFAKNCHCHLHACATTFIPHRAEGPRRSTPL